MPRDVHHPLFARFFDRLSVLAEGELGQHRDTLLAGLTGRVLEIGAGNGVNFVHYPPSVEEVVAVEPEPYLRAKAKRTAEAAPIPVTVRSGLAEELDLSDASFNAAVACQVLCTVRDLPRALAELRRVLRQPGELRFLEHVRAPGARKERLQVLADRSGIWPLIGGGCHCSRRTVEAIAAAGFRVERTQSLEFGPSWLLTNPHVLGWAVS